MVKFEKIKKKYFFASLRDRLVISLDAVGIEISSFGGKTFEKKKYFFIQRINVFTKNFYSTQLTYKIVRTHVTRRSLYRNCQVCEKIRQLGSNRLENWHLPNPNLYPRNRHPVDLGAVRGYNRLDRNCVFFSLYH